MAPDTRVPEPKATVMCKRIDQGRCLQPPNPKRAGTNLARGLEDAHCRYAARGPLVAQAVRCRALAGALREIARWLDFCAVELEAVDAHVSELLGDTWWITPHHRDDSKSAGTR